MNEPDHGKITVVIKQGHGWVQSDSDVESFAGPESVLGRVHGFVNFVRVKLQNLQVEQQKFADAKLFFRWQH